MKQNRAIFLDFALRSFASIFDSLHKERLKRVFRDMKNEYNHDTFEKSSKKIFFKIGLATLLLTIQKSDYRGAKWGLQKLKKNSTVEKVEEDKYEILRKKFDNLKRI